MKTEKDKELTELLSIRIYVNICGAQERREEVKAGGGYFRKWEKTEKNA